MTKTATKAGPKGVAYSYIRFSHPDQAKGDSLRRQTEHRDAWLARNGVALDTNVSMQDRGVSGFTGEHRTNADRHALAAFLELVRQGRIAKGSYLIVESLDRLSREHIRPALTLLLNLIEHDIRVVQLLPVEMIYDKSVEPMTLMMAIMELSRGNSESRLKSERVGGAWKDKRRRAAEDLEPLTGRSPAWLRLVDGKWELIEDAVAAVRKIFRLAIDGYGLTTIAKRLNNDGIPAPGGSEFWAKSSLAKILNNRATVGEYQPYTGRAGKRKPDGEPIPGYYPVIIKEQEWFAARAAMSARKNKVGRPAKATINLFVGLLRDSRTGDSFSTVDKGEGNGGRLLIPYHGTQGVGDRTSFPAVAFERAVLSCLKEIDPLEILPKKDRSGEKVLALSGRLEDVEGRMQRIKAKLLESPDVESLADVLGTLEGQRKAVAAELAVARQEAASPAMEAWGQCRSLIETMDAAPDQADARVRLRATIRSIVESIWLLVVPLGRDRLLAAQIWFKAGNNRSYLILHYPAQGGFLESRPAGWRWKSLASTVPGKLDLRKQADTAELEKALAKLTPHDVT